MSGTDERIGKVDFLRVHFQYFLSFFHWVYSIFFYFRKLTTPLVLQEKDVQMLCAHVHYHSIQSRRACLENGYGEQLRSPIGKSTRSCQWLRRR